jgi:hypothetical protein
MRTAHERSPANDATPRERLMPLDLGVAEGVSAMTYSPTG